MNPLNETPSKTSAIKNLYSADKDSLNYSKTTENFGLLNKNANRDSSTIRENMPLLTDSTNNEPVCPKFPKANVKRHLSSTDKKSVFMEKIDLMIKSRNSKKYITSSPYIMSEGAINEFKEKSKHKYSDALNRIKSLSNREIEDQELNFVEEIKELETQQEDENYTSMLYENLDNVELSNAYFTFMTIISAILSHNFRFYYDYYQDYPAYSHRDSLLAAEKACLAICSITVLLFIFTTIFRYIIQFRIFKSTKQLMKSDNFFKTSGFVYMCLEIFYAIIHPNLLFDRYKFTTNGAWYLVEVPYHANDYLTFFTTFRMFTILRCVAIYTYFYNYRAYRVHKMFGSDLTVTFALRSLYRSYPWRVVFFFAVAVTCIGAYCLRIIEGPVWYVVEASRTGLNDYRSYENCVWNTFVTMSTVGYGDYYALTNFGRLVAITISIFGSVLVSLTAVTIQNFLNLSSEEQKALQQLVRLQDRHEINVASATQVRCTWEYLKYKNQLLNAIKSGNTSTRDLSVIQANLKWAVINRIKSNKKVKKLLHKFRNIHELPDEFDTIDNLIQSVENLVEVFNDKLEGNKKAYKTVKKYIEVMHTFDPFKESHNTSESFAPGNEGSVKASESFCCSCKCHLYK